MPCSAAHYLGMTLDAETIPASAMKAKQYKDLSIPELFKQIKPHEEHMLSIECDDCESLTFLTQMLKRTWISSNFAPEAIESECKKVNLFSKWTPECWQKVSALMKDGQQMLHNGNLVIPNCVGLTSAESAGDDSEDAGSSSGHCHAMGIYTSDTSDTPYCFMVEGTALMRQISVQKDTPKFSAKFSDPSTKKWEQKTIDMASGLTVLSKGITMYTRIINSAGGQPKDDTNLGWNVGHNTSGWVGHQMTMSSLDSAPEYPLKFYNKVLYSGLISDDEYIGSLPVNGKDCELHAGCKPQSFRDNKVRGIGIKLDKETLQTSYDIMNEATPPLADMTTIAKVMNKWVPCKKIYNLNKDVEEKTQNKYYVTNSMESPADPTLIPIIYIAKQKLFDAANKINLEKKDTDGIFSLVRRMGTGVNVTTFVPQDKSITLTYLASIKSAAKMLEWPSNLTISE